MNYITKEELKTRLGKKTADTTDDAFLDDCITRASRIIDLKTNSIFYEKTITNEKLDVFSVSESGLYIDFDSKRIWFPAPIVSITSIAENDTTLTADDDYYIYESEGKVERSTSWTQERKGIEITAHFGYATTPEEIKISCLEIAAALSNLDVKTVVDDEGDEFSVISKSMPKWVFDILQTKRKINV